LGSTLRRCWRGDRINDPTLAVPQIVIESLAYLQNDAVLQTEGLFRLSGSLTKIMEFKALYDAFKPANLSEAVDPNVVSGVLKLWLRELPEPLMLYENYDEFIRVAKAGAADELAQYRALCESLPVDNLNLLRVLMWLCRDVANYEETNKMSPTNLAIVFGPNLLKSASVDMMTAAEDSQYINDIFKKIIVDPEQVVGARELAVLHQQAPGDASSSGIFDAQSSGIFDPQADFATAQTDNAPPQQLDGDALRLDLVALDASNGACADCSTPDPMFVSVNTGALLCEACFAAHAGTLALQLNACGTSLSRPVPLSTAAAEPLIVEFLRKCSNVRLNQVLEHAVPAGIKIKPGAVEAARKKYVVQKYAQRTFADHNQTQRSQQASLVELLQDGDFHRVHAAVLLGASVSQLSVEGAPIHEAVRQRDAAAAALLLLNGADANAMAPAEGMNAVQLAQQSGDVRLEKFVEQYATLAAERNAANTAAPPAAAERRPPPFGAVNLFGDAPPTLRRGPATRGPSMRGPAPGPGGPAPGRTAPAPGPAIGPAGGMPPSGGVGGGNNSPQLQPAPPQMGGAGGGGLGIAAGAMAAAGGMSRRGPAAAPGLGAPGPNAGGPPGGPLRRAMPGMGAPGLSGPPGGGLPGGGGGGGGGGPSMARPDRVPPGPGNTMQMNGGAGAPPPAAAASGAPVDPNYIDIAGNDLSKFDWFHGKLSSAEAFKLLQHEAKGAFLVRCSSRPGHFVVSWVQEPNNIIHTLVSPRPGGEKLYDIEGDKVQYTSVPMIMTSYSKHLLKLVLRQGKLQ
jgi:hypothetical protein